MNIVSLKCPNCMANLEANANLGKITCNFCGADVTITSNFDEGYENEKGRIKAQEDYHRHKVEEQRRNMISNGRVNTIDDADTNRELFELYGKLIEPVRSYEQVCNKISSDEIEIKKFPKKLVPPIEFIIPIIIVMIIVQFLFSCYMEISPLTPTHKRWVKLSVEDKNEYDNNYDLYLFDTSGFYKYMCGANTIEEWKFINLVRAAAKRAIMLLILYYAISVVLEIKAQKDNKKEFEELSIKKQEMEQVLSKVIRYVPIEYRTSDALQFFYSSYQTSRVDNVKEAIHAYDSHQQHKEVMGGLRQIAVATLTVATEVNALRGDVALLNSSLFALNL